jgi:gamma-resorcylate decarboxylase
VEGKIALEEHFSTELNNRLWDAKGEETRNGVAYTRDIERRLLDVKACLTEMDRSGIEMCILSLTSPGVQGVADLGQALALARDANDYASSVVKAHPDRLAAFAAVPLQNPAEAADELERAVKELGLKGALINGYSNLGPNEHVQYLDEEPVREFWHRVAVLGVPVYLHPREPLPSQRRVIQGYPELVGSAWGFAYETSSHAVRLMLSGLFDEYRGIQIILGTSGRVCHSCCLAFSIGSMRNATARKERSASAGLGTISATIFSLRQAATSMRNHSWRRLSKSA